MLLFVPFSSFELHCILSLIEPMGPKPWQLQHMYCALVTCGSEAGMGICHAIIACSSAACDAYAMQSFRAISETMAYRQCLHYMQFWSLLDICYAIITCKSGVYGGDAMPWLSAIFELVIHMRCWQIILCTALQYYVLLYIISCYIAF